ncbi:cystatin-A-like [Engystomops pustulosus]|uniref:cystatin-A-like n=1 Tax=Engystomops pustulosus TaxID=76066 RepID=UPI003AFA3E89
MNTPEGLSEEKQATPEVQTFCDKVKDVFLKKSGIKATRYLAVRYRSQVAVGTLYFVLVDVGDQFCILKILIPLPNSGEGVTLIGFQCGKEKDCSIMLY